MKIGERLHCPGASIRNGSDRNLIGSNHPTKSEEIPWIGIANGFDGWIPMSSNDIRPLELV